MEVSPDREKTVFTTGTIIPFGLCNAPATFELLTLTVFHGLIIKICLVYLDHAVVFGPTIDKLLQQLNILFDELRGAGLRLSPEKCQLFQKEVRYRGFLISENGLAADPEKTNAIAIWPVPKDAHEVRSLLGLGSYYQ